MGPATTELFMARSLVVGVGSRDSPGCRCIKNTTEKPANSIAQTFHSTLICPAAQFTCKLLYLFFPRDIHNSFGIVVQAVA
jgi:hypothetical protein